MFRIQKLSKNLVDSLLVPFEEKKEYREIYEYSMEVLLSTIANLMVIITLALLFHIESNVFCYMLFFLPYRFLYGGAHAKTHVRCIGTFAVTMIVWILVARQVPNTGFLLEAGFAVILGVNALDYRNAEKKCIGKTVVCIVASVILLFGISLVSENCINGLCGVFALITQAVSLEIKNERWRDYEKVI